MDRELIEQAYQCPLSGKSLRLGADRVEAVDGSERYPIVDGCVMFRGPGEPSVENEETRRVDATLMEARRSSWRTAVDSIYKVGSRDHRYITEGQRCTFMDLLPMTRESVVLEIGCSMGQHTSELAGRCRTVFALDIIPQQAVFTALRAEQDGFENVHVACGGDGGRLPYKNGAFDVVIMNLVVEWCAMRTPEPHEQVQRRLLEQAARVLKPGGTAFVLTKNRYALALIAGHRDAHVHQIRFGSALPRAVSRWVLNRRGLPRQPGWLHSHNALVGMFRRSGFGSVRTFWAAPEMRYPGWFVPTDVESVRAARREYGVKLYDGRLSRLMLPWMPPGLVRHFTPALCVVATTPP